MTYVERHAEAALRSAFANIDEACIQAMENGEGVDGIGVSIVSRATFDDWVVCVSSDADDLGVPKSGFPRFLQLSNGKENMVEMAKCQRQLVVDACKEVSCASIVIPELTNDPDCEDVEEDDDADESPNDIELSHARRGLVCDLIDAMGIDTNDNIKHMM